jgi:hypothetical protein
MLNSRFISAIQNALKITYSDAQFQNFFVVDPQTPAPRGGDTRGMRIDKRKAHNSLAWGPTVLTQP